jgi:hypothetical protein
MQTVGLARGVVGLAGLADTAALGGLLYATWDALVYVAFHNKTMTLSDHHIAALGDGMNQVVAAIDAVVAPWLALCAALTALASLRKLHPMAAFGVRALDAALLSLLVLAGLEHAAPELLTILLARLVLDVWALAALGYLQARGGCTILHG